MELIDKESLIDRFEALFKTSEMFDNFTISKELILKTVAEEKRAWIFAPKETMWKKQSEKDVMCSTCGAVRSVETQKGWSFCPY